MLIQVGNVLESLLVATKGLLECVVVRDAFLPDRLVGSPLEMVGVALLVLPDYEPVLLL